MEIKIKNIGVLRQAEFSLGDITIICGKNNTGKTYASYALFGFLNIYSRIMRVDIDKNNVKELLNNGITKVNIDKYIEDIQNIVNKTCERYKKIFLPGILASLPQHFKKVDFQIELDKNEKQINISENIKNYHPLYQVGKSISFDFDSEKKSNEIIFSIIQRELSKKDGIPSFLIERTINDVIIGAIFTDMLPKPFIISAERTGISVFGNELSFLRNKIAQNEKETFNQYSYPYPIGRNSDVLEQIAKISKRKSYIAQNNPDILDFFKNIMQGSIDYNEKNNELTYTPKNSKVKLSMDESSSSIRSLFLLEVYLKHIARPKDLLIIDEPELSLHPENQRLMARLFVRLINAGIRVLITTHSDYIVKEINTLIMLNGDSPHLKEIAREERYIKNELVSGDKIKIYLATKKPIKLDGNKNKTICGTFSEIAVNEKSGIRGIDSFDDTIASMNRIQDKILLGDFKNKRDAI